MVDRVCAAAVTEVVEAPTPGTPSRRAVNPIVQEVAMTASERFLPTCRGERPPSVASAMSQAIENGRRGLTDIARRRARLSPQADVDRVVAQYVRPHFDLSPAELRAVLAALLNYAFQDLHGDRWFSANAHRP